MTVGNRSYSENDMLRMQQDAEERVREMRNRSNQTTWQEEIPMPAFAKSSARSRSWNNSSGTEQKENPQQHEENSTEQNSGHSHNNADRPIDEKKESSTIIEDIVSSLGIDSDRMLIIGLILVLINQKADTTLILALAYLLI